MKSKAEWVSDEWLEKVIEKVASVKQSMIGNKAKEIKYYTADGNSKSLYMINADYTVLIFYEPGCGHCKKSIDKLKPIADEFWEKGVEVLAFYTQAKKEEWTRFIEKKELTSWHNAWDPYGESGFRESYGVNSTPLVFLLDKEKTIIAKHIDIETLEFILKKELGIEDNEPEPKEQE